MSFNPHKHHRRSIRLKGYDYAQVGMYFITICCEHRICRFGEIRDHSSGDLESPDEYLNCDKPQIHLNPYGQIAMDEWEKLSARFPNIKTDAFQIMPNHIHAIIIINDTVTVNTVGAGLAPDPFNPEISNTDGFVFDNFGLDERATARVAPTDEGISQTNAGIFQTEISPPTKLSDIVGAYKSMVANGCLKIFKTNNVTMGTFWQRNYYEHIIRNERAYFNICNYIANNPANWSKDSLK